MNLKNVIYISILIFLPVFISGKIKKYKLQNNINHSPKVVSQIVDGVTVQKLELSIMESKDIFGEQNGIKINNNFQPILFSIKNDSKQTIKMDYDDIDLDILNSNNIAKTLHKNILLRSFIYVSSYSGYLVIAFPLALAFAMGAAAPDPPFWAPVPIFLLSILACVLPVAIVSNVYDLKSYNDSLNKNFAINTICENTTINIAPGEEILKLIFLDSEDYDGTFNIEIKDQNNKKLKFELLK